MKIYIQVYSDFSLDKEIDVSHLPLNKLIPLMFHYRFEYTRITYITTDEKVLFKYNSRLDKTTTIQDLINAYCLI